MERRLLVCVLALTVWSGAFSQFSGVRGAGRGQAQTAPPAGQTGQAAAPAAGAPGDTAKKPEPEEGIPVTSDVVRQACGACHKSDDKQRMTRISYRRTTPEGWQETIKRMVSLNGVQLEPDTARQVLRYLANSHGLAPEEAQPAYFEVERRTIEWRYTADRDTENTCRACHSLGRVISQRRSKSDWEGLIAMHRGYYPYSDFQAFRRGGPPQTTPGPDGRPPDNRHPMDKAIAHLTGAFPLLTPEWSAWSANMRAPRLAGTWSVTGSQAGKGPVYGTVTIRAKEGTEDEFTTEAKLVFARTGAARKREGKSIVYTGFQWRGRSNEGPSDKDGMREVMFIDRNMSKMKGRWFTGGYDETGMDIQLERIGSGVSIAGLDRGAMQQGASGTYTVYGANFPRNLAAGDVDFGVGVKVGAVSSTPGELKVDLEVAKDAKVGRRDIFIAGAVKEGGCVIYDKIDEIKVRPQAGMARVGGANFPKQYQQFEAVAFNYGADGKPDTKDDLDLGPVTNVTWGLEEYTATFGDDDLSWVGTLDANGFFTPNLDGPNPKRKGNGNNVGDVWVTVVMNRSGKDKDGKELRPLRARAHLLVTVPLYMRWDQPEVAK